MLIDSTHKKWFVVTALLAAVALAVHGVASRQSLDGLTGGSFVGLWYGVIGAALLVYVGLLGALRRVPSWWWIGARKTWLRGHLWMGMLAGVCLLCHSGFRWGGVLTTWLWIVYLAVVVTGLYGLLAQQLVPRMMTARIPCEAPFEQIPHICRVMRRQADALIDTLCGPYDPSPQRLNTTVEVICHANDARAQLRDFFERDVRPFLQPKVSRASPLLNPLQAEARFAKLSKLGALADVREQVAQLATLCEERRMLAEQERLHFWLHAWLLLHVPLAVLLLVLGATHAVAALYY